MAGLKTSLKMRSSLGALISIGARRQPQGGGVVDTYLPDVAGATPWGWSVNKMYSTTSTNALTATRLSPSANQNIGFVGANFDLAAAVTFQGASTLTNSKVFEQHGVTAADLVPVSTAPDLWLGNGGPDWSTYSQTAPLAIPSSVTFDRQNCTIVLVCRNPGMGAACGYFGFGAGTDDFGLRSYSNQYTLQPIVDGAVTTAASPNNKTIGVCGDELIIVHSNASRCRICRDGEYTDFPAVSSKVLNAGGIVGKAFSLAGRIDIKSFEIIPLAISDAEILARQTAYRSKFNTQALTILESWLVAGNSIAFGVAGFYNRTISAEWTILLPRTTIVRNIGISGHYMGGPNLSGGHYDDWKVSPTRFKTAGAMNGLVIEYGHNDIYQYIANQGKTAAQALAEMQNGFKLYCADARSLAGFDKIIIQETLPDTSGGSSWTAEMEKCRQLWNAWISTMPVDANGVICWNAVDKVATDDTNPLSDAQTNSIPVATPTGTFTQFETVTGGTSGATAMLARSKTGRFILFGVTGTFQSAEILTGGTSGATVATTGPRVAQGMTLLSNSSDGTHPNEPTAPTRATHLEATRAAAPATPLSMSYTPITVGYQNTPYIGATPVVYNAVAPVVFSLRGGAPPTNYAINSSTGVVAGTDPNQETATGIIVRATDATGAFVDSAPFQIAVGPAQLVSVVSHTPSLLPSDLTAFPIALPSAVSMGEILFTPMANDGNSTVTWDDATAGTFSPAKFNDVQTANRLVCYAKVADGTEGGKTLGVTISAAQQAVAEVLRLSGAQGAMAFSSTGQRGTGAGIDPAALSSGFPAGNNTLWIAALALDNYSFGVNGTINPPTGYTLLTPIQTSSASGQATLAVAYRSNPVATEDPSGWSWTGSLGYVHMLAAVRAA